MSVAWVPVMVLLGLVPGVWLGVRGPRWLGVLLLAELGVAFVLGLRPTGLGCVALAVGRAHARLDPRFYALPGLHPWGDVAIPLLAPGIFGGAVLAFASSVALGTEGWVAGVLVSVGLGLAATLDLQHQEALQALGIRPGGALLLPHLTVGEQLGLCGIPVPEALTDQVQRRPRALGDADRTALSRALSSSLRPN